MDDVIRRMDEDFEKLLASYLIGPKTQDDYDALVIQVNALDNIRARGEWQKWYHRNQILWDTIAFIPQLFMFLPCGWTRTFLPGGWKGHDHWREKHPSPDHWNLDKRAPRTNNASSSNESNRSNSGPSNERSVNNSGPSNESSVSNIVPSNESSFNVVR